MTEMIEIENKMKTKSLGLAIVLTLFLGPLGVFYASITGGLIMCLTPVLLFALFVFGSAADSSFLLASSLVLLIVFAISYWIICVIWAATSVSNHNNKVNDAVRQAELLKQLKETKPTGTSTQNTNITRQNSIHESQLNSDRPSLQDWKKVNINGSINDYYRIYGVPESSVNTRSYIDTTKKNYNLPITLFFIQLVLLLFY
jgi:predicted membrane protein